MAIYCFRHFEKFTEKIFRYFQKLQNIIMDVEMEEEAPAAAPAASPAQPSVSPAQVITLTSTCSGSNIELTSNMLRISF